jgi:hypothetical protein
MTFSAKAPTKIRLFGSFLVEGGDSSIYANEWRRKKAAEVHGWRSLPSMPLFFHEG